MSEKKRTNLDKEVIFKIHERLKKLREDTETNQNNCISKRGLAKEIGVVYSRISLLEDKSDTTIPSVNDLLAYSDYFKVSIDYLLCRSNMKTSNENIKSIAKTTGLTESSISVLTELQNEKENNLDIPPTIQAINIILSNENIIEMLSPITEYIYSVKESTGIKKVVGFDETVDGVMCFGKDKTKMNEMNELHDRYKHEFKEVQPLCLFNIQHNLISYITEYAKKFAIQGFVDPYMYELEKITQKQIEELSEVPEALKQISEVFRELAKHSPKEGE